MLSVLNTYRNTHTHTHMPAKGPRTFLEMTDMSITLIMGMVSQVYACVQTHHTVPSKYVQFFTYQLHLNKLV